MIKRILKPLGILVAFATIPFIIFGVMFMFPASGSEDKETLFVQKIKNSDLLIVDYDVWYGRDGNVSGRTILKSTKGFNFREIKKLPLSFLNDISSDSINSIKLVSSGKNTINNDIRLLKTETTQIGDIKLNTRYYEKCSVTKYCMLNEYSFDSFLETEDSLYLYGINRKFGNTYKDLTETGIKKGNIKIQSDSLGKVLRLEVEDLILTNGDYYVYEQGTANIIDTVRNNSIVCIATSYMIPTSKIYESDFTDYGFFKKVK